MVTKIIKGYILVNILFWGPIIVLPSHSLFIMFFLFVQVHITGIKLKSINNLFVYKFLLGPTSLLSLIHCYSKSNQYELGGHMRLTTNARLLVRGAIDLLLCFRII